jgi:hypothetical protein
MLMRHHGFLCVLGIALAGACGCGSGGFSVKGKVTYNGAVLDKPDGRVVFVGLKGEQSVAAIEPDGSYRATRVASGLNKVVVYYPNPEIKMNKKVKRNPDEPTVLPFLTPAEYASVDSTSLSIMVGKETLLDVNLEGPPIP